MYWSPSFSVEWIVFTLIEVPLQLDSGFRRRALLVSNSLAIQSNSVHHLIILSSEFSHTCVLVQFCYRSNVFRSMKSLNKQALHIHCARHNSSSTFKLTPAQSRVAKEIVVLQDSSPTLAVVASLNLIHQLSSPRL